MSFLKHFALSSFLLTATSLHASEIYLSKNIVSFENNQHKKVTIDVVNINKETPAYVKAIAREVLEPQKGSKSKLSDNLSPAKVGLFVTPNKQIIKKGQNKGLISIVNINKDMDKERVYRVDVAPVISGIKQNEQQDKAIKVLLAYDILVYVQPNNPVFTFEHGFEDNAFLIENTGNSHFKLMNGKICQNDNCSPAPTGNLFADQVSAIPIPTNTTHITYEVFMKGKPLKKVTFERQ